LFLEWSTTLLGLSTVQGTLLASTLAKIISGLLTSTPDTPLCKLDYLSEASLNQVCLWNNSISIQPVERRIHDVIADRVLDNPDAEAVCAWDGSLTYRELDEVTDRLVPRLVQLGVGPEVLVPLCFDKSVSGFMLRYPVPFLDVILLFAFRTAHRHADLLLTECSEMDSSGNARRAESWRCICPFGPISPSGEASESLPLGGRQAHPVLPTPRANAC
jgi:hypothetical protein